MRDKLNWLADVDSETFDRIYLSASYCSAQVGDTLTTTDDIAYKRVDGRKVKGKSWVKIEPPTKRKRSRS